MARRSIFYWPMILLAWLFIGLAASGSALAWLHPSLPFFNRAVVWVLSGHLAVIWLCYIKDPVIR